MSSDRKYLKKILYNLCEIYNLTKNIEILDLLSNSNNTVLTDSNIYILEQDLNTIQAASTIENIQDLIKNYDNKMKTLNKILNKTVHLRSIINETISKIDKTIKKKQLGGTALANELNFSKISLEQLSKNLDSIEYSLNNIINDLRSAELNIQNLKSSPPEILINTDPQLILNIKNLIQRNSNAITSIRKNLNDIETKILNIKQPIDKISKNE